MEKIMNIFEAIKWLSPSEREQLIKDIEKQNLDGVEIVDYVTGHFNMACRRILTELYRLSDYDKLTDELKRLLTNESSN